MNGMIQKLALLLAMLAGAFGMNANPVDIRTAREVAVKFVNANAKTPLRSAEYLQLVATYNIDRGDAAFHIFNTPNGFVIVSADDCATPILGYSDEGQFNLENIPIQLQDYLQDFVEQIGYGIEQRLTADEVVAEQWNSVKTYGVIYESRATTNAVEPLLTSTWDQGCYYNNLCPQGGPCGHALTGCVATAMGQIMRYWGYPVTGTGSITYTPSGYPQQSVNFMEAVYDYDNMPDYLNNSSNSTQVNAVATLLWHCGVAVRARYGSDGTTASHYYVPIVLKDNFLYSSDLYIQYKNDVGNEVWLNQVKACLDLSRPLYYGGGGGGMNVAGHAFVCDGYDSNDLLHFNWGWSGVDDGYYAINALSTSNGGYTNDQLAVFDIHPRCNGEMYQVSAPCTPSNGGTVTGAGTYECGSVCTLTATANEGYRFYYWTLDGELVALDDTYSFVVMDNIELVANFGLPIEITATANPSEGGAVSGGGEYSHSHTCTLTATPSDGYVFNNWTKNGEVVSYLSSYSFLVTEDEEYVANFQQADGIVIGGAEKEFYYLPMLTFNSLSEQIYTAEEMGGEACEISCVSFFNTYHLSSTHNITVYMVNTDKTAFESNTDWIAVTEADKVFNGSVTIGPKGWSTIYFDTPFVYDGSSNMVLVVDDNTNTHVNTSNYRTFNTDESQAIYAFSGNINFDPYNPSNYTGHLATEKNQVILGLPSYDNAVTVTAEPADFGTVSGGGMYYYGQKCTLSATANDGYCFYYWTENGTIVSYSTTYSFTVMNDKELVANFGLPLNIVVATDPVDGGTVSGGGEYDYRQTCTLTAIANEGYSFMNWTENGVSVSTNATYSFMVTGNRELVAHFSLPVAITVSANPVEGGSVSGAGMYDYGSTCTLSATSNPGYVFTKWTKNGSTVSYLSDYSVNVTEAYEYVAHFEWVSPDIVVGQAQNENTYLPSDAYCCYTLSQQIYTVEEIGTACEISTISFYNTSYAKTRNYSIYLLHTDKSTFQNSTDWITVTEADKVFSGRVNLPDHEWTTIALDTLFNYNGTSNLALIVDDNTGSYEDNIYHMMKCRVYNTDGYQSIVAVSDGINYDPYNPSNYNGSLKLVKNQVILGVPSYDYTVTVSADPEEFGTVSGGGACYHYQPITLTATANEGYMFTNWTKNGNVVSYVSNFSFNVMESAEYVAHFEPIPDNSILIGESTVSNDFLPSHSFCRYTLSQQIYTSDEIGGACEISNVSFFNAGTTKNRNYTIYMVLTDKSRFESDTDWIAVSSLDQVFSGSVNMAAGEWTTIAFDLPFNYDGVSNIALIVDDNTGSRNSGMSCRVFDTKDPQAIRILSDNTNYDPYNPSGYTGTLHSEKNQIILGIENGVGQTIELSAGTNWFSTYLDITLADLQSALVEALPNATSITIKSQRNGQSSYNGTQWRGALGTLNVALMYQITVPESCEIELEGMPINPAEHPITIKSGPNWIGFPFGVSMTPTDAFAGFAVSGDVLRSRTQQANYTNRWRGALGTLESGQGYIYNSAATGDRILTFPRPTNPLSQ